MPRQSKQDKQTVKDEAAAEVRHQAKTKEVPENAHFVKTDAKGNGYFVSCGKRHKV